MFWNNSHNQTWQKNCKATNRNTKKSPLRFEDESVKTEIVQKFYLSGQNWYWINSLKETSVLNFRTSVNLQLN